MSDFTAELAGLPQQNRNLTFSHLHGNGIKRSMQSPFTFEVLMFRDVRESQLRH